MELVLGGLGDRLCVLLLLTLSRSMLQSPLTPPIGITSSISSSGGDLIRIFLSWGRLIVSFHLIRRSLELSSGD